MSRNRILAAAAPAAAVLAAALAPAAPVRAAGPGLDGQLAQVADKIPLEGRKGPSLFQPGFQIGDYVGWAKMTKASVRAAGIVSSDKAKGSLEVERPGLSPVTGACGGGQGRIGLGWITFKRDKLSYVCSYGGSAPAGAEFALAAGKGGGGFLNRLAQPQRAAELDWGRFRLHAETQLISGLPLGGGAPISYVITRPDGTVLGGLQTNGLRPVFWLPKAPGPERDAVAVMAVTLFAFRDPGA